MVRPRWQLPKGVSRESWDYIQSEKIALQYEDFLGQNPLFRLDVDLVQQQIEPLQKQFSARELYVADLGCGTARVARALDSEICRILNIDLSQAMLLRARELARERRNAFELQGNLAELQFLRPDCLHLAVCLFSSLGMLRPREQRIQFLTQVCDSLKQKGRLVVHVHNRYRSLLDPGGMTWLAYGLLRHLRGKGELGDRVYPYRGLPRMFLHIYSRRELIADLQQAGFRTIEILPIHVSGSTLLPSSTQLVGLRAGGFFAVAEK